MVSEPSTQIRSLFGGSKKITTMLGKARHEFLLETSETTVGRGVTDITNELLKVSTRTLLKPLPDFAELTVHVFSEKGSNITMLRDSPIVPQEVQETAWP